MKKIWIIGLVCFVLVNIGPVHLYGEAKYEELGGTVSISGAWALYPMAVKWAEEFQKLYPKIKIDIAAGGAGKGMADCLAQVVDIGMVSREVYPEERAKGAWWVSVVRDAVVPTLNENNPLIRGLMSRGFKREEAVDIWITGNINTWSELVKHDRRYEIHVYTRSDACGAAETWARYLGKNQEDLKGVGIYGDPGLAEAVIRDELGIGFNNINYAYESNSKKPLKGIRVFPLDLNGDGKITEDEDFYANRDGIVNAIAQGIYPSPPARDLHFVCCGRPKKEVARVFIQWVLTEGQKYVAESGYIPLGEEKLKAQLKKLELE